MKKLTEAEDLFGVLKGVLDDIEGTVTPRVVTFNDLMIRPKDGTGLVNLGANLNDSQKRFLDLLEIDPFQKFDLVGHRWVKLKARQMGFTTLIAALFFCDTVNNPLRYSVIMAHDDVTTRKIFEIIKRFYDNLPEEKKPTTKYNTKTDLTFDKLDSQIYVATAGNRSSGQGTTVNNVLGSEVASWPNPDDVNANLLQAVPATGNIFLESTAEGVGNFFHIAFMEAVEGENSFRGDFSPWFEHEEYQKPVPEGFEPNDYELGLMKNYNVTLPQIAWYRDKAKTLKHLVFQEYPSTPEEAFISSGGDFFDAEVLQEYIETSKTLVPVALPGMEKLPHYYKECHNTKRAQLILWEYPHPEHKYIVTGDSSEGEADSKSDFSSVDIIDVDTCTQVGHLHGKIEPHVLARVLVEIGYYFNTALIVPERNNHGHTVINEIMHHTNYPKMDMYGWGGLYYFKDYDAAKRQFTMKPGMPTTSKTKFMMLDALNTLVANRELAISSTKSLVEMLNYKSLGKGKYGAPNGLHDDRVISLALGAYVLLNRPKTKVKSVSRNIRKGHYV